MSAKYVQTLCKILARMIKPCYTAKLTIRYNKRQLIELFQIAVSGMIIINIDGNVVQRTVKRFKIILFLCGNLPAANSIVRTISDT